MAQFTQLFKEIQDNSITPIKTTFCGNLSSLETTAKDNLVNAINELKNSSGGSSGGLEFVDIFVGSKSSAGRIVTLDSNAYTDYKYFLIMGTYLINFNYPCVFSYIVPTKDFRTNLNTRVCIPILGFEKTYSYGLLQINMSTSYTISHEGYVAYAGSNISDVSVTKIVGIK